MARLRTLLVPMLLTAPFAAAAPAAEHPVRVTTDSAAYCQELAVRVSVLPSAGVPPVRTLAEEGQALCGSGQVRTGIAKLRRALRAAQGPGG
jgi:hypothetical protein